jgi:hypothetical protein
MKYKTRIRLKSPAGMTKCEIFAGLDVFLLCMFGQQPLKLCPPNAGSFLFFAVKIRNRIYENVYLATRSRRYSCPLTDWRLRSGLASG